MESPDGWIREGFVDRREPGAGEVLVRIAASGLNPLDTKIRAGQAEHARQPLPAVLGLDMAGAVEEVGPAVTAFKRGDEVYGAVGGVGGLQGTLAEFITVDADLLSPQTEEPVDTAGGGSSVERHHGVGGSGGSGTCCVRIRRFWSMEGAGGVGHIAIQIAQAFGARVFATVSPEKTHIVEGFGASPIDYRATSVEQYVDACTEGRGSDIVYDTVGGETLDASFAAVKRYTGHVVSSLGWGSHSLAPLSFRGATYSGVFTLLPLLTGENRAHHGGILAQAAALAEAGKLRPLLSAERFSVSGIDAAFARVSAGAPGKVVVEIGD